MTTLVKAIINDAAPKPVRRRRSRSPPKRMQPSSGHSTQSSSSFHTAKSSHSSSKSSPRTPASKQTYTKEELKCQESRLAESLRRSPLRNGKTSEERSEQRPRKTMSGPSLLDLGEEETKKKSPRVRRTPSSKERRPKKTMSDPDLFGMDEPGEETKIRSPRVRRSPNSKERRPKKTMSNPNLFCMDEPVEEPKISKVRRTKSNKDRLQELRASRSSTATADSPDMEPGSDGKVKLRRSKSGIRKRGEVPRAKSATGDLLRMTGGIRRTTSAACTSSLAASLRRTNTLDGAARDSRSVASADRSLAIARSMCSSRVRRNSSFNQKIIQDNQLRSRLSDATENSRGVRRAKSAAGASSSLAAALTRRTNNVDYGDARSVVSAARSVTRVRRSSSFNLKTIQDKTRQLTKQCNDTDDSSEAPRLVRRTTSKSTGDLPSVRRAASEKIPRLSSRRDLNAQLGSAHNSPDHKRRRSRSKVESERRRRATRSQSKGAAEGHRKSRSSAAEKFQKRQTLRRTLSGIESRTGTADEALQRRTSVQRAKSAYDNSRSQLTSPMKDRAPLSLADKLKQQEEMPDDSEECTVGSYGRLAIQNPAA